MPNIIQSDRGFAYFDSSVQGGAFGSLVTSGDYLVPVGNQTIIVAPRPMRLMLLLGRVDVVGTDAGAVTFSFFKAGTGVAPGSGVLVHSGTFNLKGTLNTNQVVPLLTTDAALDFNLGDSLVAVLTGVGTAAKGSVTASFAWR